MSATNLYRLTWEVRDPHWTDDRRAFESLREVAPELVTQDYQFPEPGWTAMQSYANFASEAEAHAYPARAGAEVRNVVVTCLGRSPW